MQYLETNSPKFVLLPVFSNANLVSIDNSIGSHDYLAAFELLLKLEMSCYVVGMEMGQKYILEFGLALFQQFQVLIDFIDGIDDGSFAMRLDIVTVKR